MSLDIEAIKAWVRGIEYDAEWGQFSDDTEAAKEWMERADQITTLINEVEYLRLSNHDLRNTANQSALAMAEARMDLERVTGERDAARDCVKRAIQDIAHIMDRCGEEEPRSEGMLAQTVACMSDYLPAKIADRIAESVKLIDSGE